MAPGERAAAGDHEEVLARLDLHVPKPRLALQELPQPLARMDAEALGYLPLGVAIYKEGPEPQKGQARAQVYA